MNFSDFIHDGADISEAYMHFMIQNYQMYVSVSFARNDAMNVKSFKSEEEMAWSLIKNLQRKSAVYYFKKSDFDLFIRKGIDVHKHIQDTGRHKEIAKSLTERYKK